MCAFKLPVLVTLLRYKIEVELFSGDSTIIYTYFLSMSSVKKKCIAIFNSDGKRYFHWYFVPARESKRKVDHTLSVGAVRLLLQLEYVCVC